MAVVVVQSARKIVDINHYQIYDENMTTISEIHPREREQFIGTTVFVGDDRIQGIITGFRGIDTVLLEFPPGIQRPSFSMAHRVHLN